MKPFIRWAGGKQNIIDEILSFTPDHNIINRYYEPFLGAGSLYFANGFDNAVLGDINHQLVNAYRQIKQDPIKIHSLLETYQRKFSKDVNFYYYLRELYNRDSLRMNHVQAARFIFLIHSNYNGMYRVNKKGEYNVPIGKLKPNIPSLEHLLSVSRKMVNADIRCGNYIQILDHVEEHDFVYLDPPYPPEDWENPQNQYTVSNMAKNDHIDISDFATQLNQRGCYVLISYPESSFIRELYQGWNIVSLDTIRSIGGRKNRKRVTELLIKNY